MQKGERNSGTKRRDIYIYIHILGTEIVKLVKTRDGCVIYWSHTNDSRSECPLGELIVRPLILEQP